MASVTLLLPTSSSGRSTVITLPPISYHPRVKAHRGRQNEYWYTAQQLLQYERTRCPRVPQRVAWNRIGGGTEALQVVWPITAGKTSMCGFDED